MCAFFSFFYSGNAEICVSKKKNCIVLPCKALANYICICIANCIVLPCKAFANYWCCRIGRAKQPVEREKEDWVPTTFCAKSPTLHLIAFDGSVGNTKIRKQFNCSEFLKQKLPSSLLKNENAPNLKKLLELGISHHTILSHFKVWQIWKVVNRKQGQYFSQILISMYFSPNGLFLGESSGGCWSLHYALLTSYEYIVQSYIWDRIKHIWMKTHRTTSSTSYKKMPFKRWCSKITFLQEIVKNMYSAHDINPV